MSVYYWMKREALGCIRNHKTIEKIIQNCKQKKRLLKNRKTVKTNKLSHPSYKNPNQSDAVVTGGAYRGFTAIQDQWRSKILPLRLKRNRNPNRKN